MFEMDVSHLFKMQLLSKTNSFELSGYYSKKYSKKRHKVALADGLKNFEVALYFADFCAKVIIKDNAKGSFHFQRTRVGTYAQARCPYGNEISVIAETYAVRDCNLAKNATSVWSTANISGCGISMPSRQLHGLMEKVSTARCITWFCHKT